MPDLVSLSDLKTFLGGPPAADDALLTAILEHVEAMFESECGRKDKPFIAGANRTETKDGTGSRDLFLDYPISTITSVKLGYDPTDPVETLDVADPTILTFAVGARRITRTQEGAVFGWPGQPRYVQIAYTHQSELPQDAQMAVKSVCAIAYRRRGSEEAMSESVGGYQRFLSGQLADIVDVDPFWKRAVAANRRFVIA